MKRIGSQIVKFMIAGGPSDVNVFEESFGGVGHRDVLALHGFFDALRAELRLTGIKVTMICPGYIKTDISLNALTGSGAAQGTLDEAQRMGMDVNTCVDKILRAIQKGQEEAHIGGFKEVKMAGFVSRVFPATFRKIIAKAKTT